MVLKWIRWLNLWFFNYNKSKRGNIFCATPVQEIFIFAFSNQEEKYIFYAWRKTEILFKQYIVRRWWKVTLCLTVIIFLHFFLLAAKPSKSRKSSDIIRYCCTKYCYRLSYHCSFSIKVFLLYHWSFFQGSIL